jgi:sporulation protein YlmC with PRC-barrel domain
MTLNELLACDVVDAAGDVVGQVHDVSFVRRDDGQLPVYEVRHLMFAPGTVGSRLGYGYGEMHGPWPVSAFLRRLARTSGRAVEWRHVTDIRDGRIYIDARVGDLPSQLDVIEGRR